MNKISITELQRNIGDISIRLIKGEEIILTRSGKDFAKLTPVESERPKSMQTVRNLRKVVKHIASTVGAEEVTATIHPQTAGRKCEAPFVNCRFAGDLYEIKYMDQDDGILTKQVWLCPGHAKKTRESSNIEKMNKI